eukprot:m.208864 g.208864  ORF g.208864 m.208864 type:complete len:62 (+) comp39717_c0_seq42:1623-1808(+)
MLRLATFMESKCSTCTWRETAKYTRKVARLGLEATSTYRKQNLANGPPLYFILFSLKQFNC